MNTTNEEKPKKTVGRPPLYKNPEELQLKIDKYFKNGFNLRKVVVGPPNKREVALLPVITITGLVRYCGFADRAAFYDYEKKPEFCHTIKSARNRIEETYEELLQSGLGAGAIFALKNFGWIDTPLIDQSFHQHFVIFRNPQSLKEENAGITPRAEVKDASVKL